MHGTIEWAHAFDCTATFAGMSPRPPVRPDHRRPDGEHMMARMNPYDDAPECRFCDTELTDIDVDDGPFDGGPRMTGICPNPECHSKDTGDKT